MPRFIRADLNPWARAGLSVDGGVLEESTQGGRRGFIVSSPSTTAAGDILRQTRASDPGIARRTATPRRIASIQGPQLPPRNLEQHLEFVRANYTAPADLPPDEPTGREELVEQDPPGNKRAGQLRPDPYEGPRRLDVSTLNGRPAPAPPSRPATRPATGIRGRFTSADASRAASGAIGLDPRRTISSQIGEAAAGGNVYAEVADRVAARHFSESYRVDPFTGMIPCVPDAYAARLAREIRRGRMRCR